jgi:hypothetical protein
MKGDKYTMSNYRQTSLLTSFSKIFEKLLFARVTQHFNDNIIIVKEQFGFRQNSSIQTSIFKLLNKILNALNTFIVGGIFFDLVHAFDCINHAILLSILEFCVTTGIAYVLIKSYPKERRQRVVTDSMI